MSKSPPGTPSVNLLAVDTATEGCSAACLAGDKSFERYAVDPQGHSRTLLGMVEAVLAEARLERSALDALAYDAGPGSFTGIRIGAGVAQGLALGLEKPLLAVSSLMTLAEGARREQPDCNSVLAAIDARMDQVYWARLESDPEAPGHWRWDEMPCVSEPREVAVHISGCTGVGSGWDRYSDVFMGDRPMPWLVQRLPHALDVATIARRLLAQGVSGAWHEAVPVYVRDRVTG